MAKPSKSEPPELLCAEGLNLIRSGEGREPFALREVSLVLRAREMALLQGPSGAGKTSLLLALARMIPLMGGELALRGRPARNHPPPEWRLRVALVSAQPVMIAGTIEENLLLPWSFKALQARPTPQAENLREMLDSLGLGKLPLGAPSDSLSTGQLGRVSLARSLLLRPEVLLLDEPTANLDPASARRVWALLTRRRKETGCAILCVTHQPPSATPHRVLRIKSGRLREA